MPTQNYYLTKIHKANSKEELDKIMNMAVSDSTGIATGDLNLSILFKEYLSETPKVTPDPNIKCEQASIIWNQYAEDGSGYNPSLETTIESLGADGYHIDTIVPLAQYQKVNTTGIYITKALIILSK